MITIILLSVAFIIGVIFGKKAMKRMSRRKND